MPCQSGIDPRPLLTLNPNPLRNKMVLDILQVAMPFKQVQRCIFAVMYFHLNPPAEITQFLFCPQSDDLSWILFAEAILETVVILDVTIPGLKFVQGCFEHFHCTLMGHRFCLPPFEPNKTTTTNIIVLFINFIITNHAIQTQQT